MAAKYGGGLPYETYVVLQQLTWNLHTTFSQWDELVDVCYFAKIPMDVLATLRKELPDNIKGVAKKIINYIMVSNNENENLVVSLQRLYNILSKAQLHHLFLRARETTKLSKVELAKIGLKL